MAALAPAPTATKNVIVVKDLKLSFCLGRYQKINCKFNIVVPSRTGDLDLKDRRVEVISILHSSIAKSSESTDTLLFGAATTSTTPWPVLYFQPDRTVCMSMIQLDHYGREEGGEEEGQRKGKASVFEDFSESKS
mmetsp:Transcript_23895/g.56443  ORF Transcript_23895/g.56443 Transcript_23895/m.56443 type:complete len:135 (+) Transcript_23895:293-697(+)